MENDTEGQLTQEKIFEHGIQILKGIRYAETTGQLELLWNPISPTNGFLSIRTGKNNEDFAYFCEVVPRSQVTVGQALEPNEPPGANDPNQPWELLVDSQEVTPDILERYLPSFIHDYYSRVENLPIIISQGLKRKEIKRIEPQPTISVS